ncbi:hypothetical protein CCUS01_13419 [Colletotrichum cuscutae]|uniref:Uncharacterized protein n=1 Tax=Colletotrichum cuscutae TaxID=1209917 RepID=A0AAI9YBS2_9PEZI|nr:hypothetical protein CCUS01_13419 [Colletotrichum cuscutae]
MPPGQAPRVFWYLYNDCFYLTTTINYCYGESEQKIGKKKHYFDTSTYLVHTQNNPSKETLHLLIQPADEQRPILIPIRSLIHVVLAVPTFSIDKLNIITRTRCTADFSLSRVKNPGTWLDILPLHGCFHLFFLGLIVGPLSRLSSESRDAEEEAEDVSSWIHGDIMQECKGTLGGAVASPQGVRDTVKEHSSNVVVFYHWR